MGLLLCSKFGAGIVLTPIGMLVASLMWSVHFSSIVHNGNPAGQDNQTMQWTGTAPSILVT